MMNESSHSDVTHIAVGISPDGFAIVLRPVTPGSLQREFSFAFSLAELACRGRNKATRKIGNMTLRLMTAFFPDINRCAATLIPAKTGKRLVIDPPDRGGAIRESHLRVHATEVDPSVVVRRFQGGISGDTSATLPLRLLVTQDPNEEPALVGATLLDE
jgi:hypothetical protein